MLNKGPLDKSFSFPSFASLNAVKGTCVSVVHPHTGLGGKHVGDTQASAPQLSAVSAPSPRCSSTYSIYSSQQPHEVGLMISSVAPPNWGKVCSTQSCISETLGTRASGATDPAKPSRDSGGGRGLQRRWGPAAEQGQLPLRSTPSCQGLAKMAGLPNDLEGRSEPDLLKS